MSRKSNRAMRSGSVMATDTELRRAALDLSNDVKAFRGSCAICCGDEEIMESFLRAMASLQVSIFEP